MEEAASEQGGFNTYLCEQVTGRFTVTFKLASQPVTGTHHAARVPGMSRHCISRFQMSPSPSRGCAGEVCMVGKKKKISGLAAFAPSLLGKLESKRRLGDFWFDAINAAYPVVFLFIVQKCPSLTSFYPTPPCAETRQVSQKSSSSSAMGNYHSLIRSPLSPNSLPFPYSETSRI